MSAQAAEELFTTGIHSGQDVPIRYLLYLPEEYRSGSQAPWPLVLFLHGAGERGNDLDQVKRHGLSREIEGGRTFPFVAVSPQCPSGQRWDTAVLSYLLDHIIQNYTIDPDRVYLSGLSMGGFGTWALAMEQPRRFAAIAPVCGGGDSDQVCVLNTLPIWAFHGAQDEVVPLARSAELINALYACGGDPRFTVYPEAHHDSWTETYKNPALYAWLLSHVRRT